MTIPCARWKDGTAAKINLSAFSANGDTMTFWSETESVSSGYEIDPASAIYVNGINTSTHASYESAGEATYWRVTDGHIVLRGSGPYSITGTGTTPVRVAITDDAYTSCKVMKKSYPGLRVKSGTELTISGADNATLICIGGKYAAGIGGGYKGLEMSFFNYGGTVWAKGGVGAA